MTNSEPRIPNCLTTTTTESQRIWSRCSETGPRLAAQAGPPFKGPDTPTTKAWESNPYNDEVIRFTVDYLTLGSKVLAAGLGRHVCLDNDPHRRFKHPSVDAVTVSTVSWRSRQSTRTGHS